MPVVEHCRMRPEGGADNLLECGHLVLFDGRRPERQRCPECVVITPQEPRTGTLW